MKTQRKSRPMSRAMAVAGIAALALAAPASPASGATTTQEAVTAVWTITDGCVETHFGLEGRSSSSGTTTFFSLDQSQTCDDPNASHPVLEMRGQITGGQLQVAPNFTGRVVATIPVTCFEYQAGACEQSPYDSSSVSLNISWDTSGRFTRTVEDGMSCRYRYGEATGSIVLGGVDLLASDGGSLPSDPTESNIKRCVAARSTA